MENGDYFEGQEVEVTTEDDEEEGSKDSWYTAKIVKLPNRKAKKRILVRFENGLNQLRTVDPAYMRPLPPQLPVQSYRLHEIVDALHKDWWLKGIITQVLDNSKYMVQVSVTEEQVEFGMEKLRVHQDWISGKWVIPQQQDIIRESIQADVREPDQHRSKPRKKLKNVKATKGSPCIDLVTPRTKGQAISQNLIDNSDTFIDLVTPTTNGEVLNRKVKSLSQNLVGTFSNSSEEVAFVDSSLSTLPKMKSEAQCSSDQVPVQFIQSKAMVSEASEEEVSPDDQLASHLRCLSIEDQFYKGIEDRQMETGTQVLSFDENRDEITLESDELQKFDEMFEAWQMLVMEMQSKSSSIVALQTMADEIKEDIEDIILDFDHLAAVPW